MSQRRHVSVAIGRDLIPVGDLAFEASARRQHSVFKYAHSWIERKGSFAVVPSRSELTLVPPCLDDDVSECNPVRAIGAFVGTLDLKELGFRHPEQRCGAGQPARDPGLLPKLCLHGCQHRVRRSCRLQAETRRNLEVIWRCRGATPSCRTIADFRNRDASALRAASLRRQVRERV